MAVATIHYLHGINTSSVFLSQIENARPTPGIEKMVARGAGVPNPQFVTNMGQRPGISFDCSQIASLLGLTGVTGMADLTAGNVDLYYKKATNLASREAAVSTVHTRLRAANAGIVLASITAGHRSQATGSCRLVFPYDGTNEPIVPAGSVALAGSSTSDEHFVAGPVYLNGSQVNGIQNITISLGVRLIEVGGDGEMYDTFVAVEETEPTISFTTTDVMWATLGLNGVAITSLSAYLRKKSTTGNVANATAQHIKFTASAGLAQLDETPAGGNSSATSTVTCTLIDTTGATNGLTVATASAITT